MDDYGERIAVLEQRYEDLSGAKQEILDKVDELGDSLREYRGFIGGVIWFAGTLAAGILLIWEIFADFFRGHWH